MLTPYLKLGNPFMVIYTKFRLAIFALLMINLLHGTAQAKNETNVLDRPANHLNTIFHVGLWVENLNEMLGFLAEIMEFNIVLRTDRQSGGERLILRDSRGQYIELLSDPENVQAHPDFLLHPQGRVAGIAHISIWAEDVTKLKSSLVVKGYEVLGQVPTDFADGYVTSDGKMYRILFVRGPSAVTFEFFEIKK